MEIFLNMVRTQNVVSEIINTFKYHVLCTDGKISVRIILITYFSTVVSLTSCVFFPGKNYFSYYSNNDETYLIFIMSTRIVINISLEKF